jgi:hypothetical protein
MTMLHPPTAPNSVACVTTDQEETHEHDFHSEDGIPKLADDFAEPLGNDHDNGVGNDFVIEDTPYGENANDESFHDDEWATFSNINPESSLPYLLTPNYAVDEATRHAALSRRLWRPTDDTVSFQRGQLGVYLQEQDRIIPTTQAQVLLRGVGIRTLMTVRIALGLWNLRHQDPRFRPTHDAARFPRSARPMRQGCGRPKRSKLATQLVAA